MTRPVLSTAIDKLLNGNTVRGKRRAPATVLRRIASLAAVFKVAHRKWNWVEASPLDLIDKPPAGRGRVRHLSSDERNRLLAACVEQGHPYLHTIVLLGISTGMRRGEILGLRWEHVDIGDNRAVGHALLLTTKNGEARGVSIAGPALKALRAFKRARENPSAGLLFPSNRPLRQKLKPGEERPPVDIRRPWEDAVAAANLKDFRFHDLRHTAASYLAMNSATGPEIAAVLGHKTLAMVKRYAHLDPSHTANVVARMNDKVFGARTSEE